MANGVRGNVCYCPDFGLYRYEIVDPDPEYSFQYKFDDEELEIAVATHTQNGDESSARVMAHVTGLARVNPHKHVLFDTEKDSIEVLSPEDFKKRSE